MIIPEQTHAGVVVDDLDAGMTRLSRDLGVRWSDVIEWELELLTPQGPTMAVNRFTYSSGNGPGIELLQAQAGTVWTATGRPHIIWGSGRRTSAQTWRQCSTAVTP